MLVAKASDLRWHLADGGEPQGALFDEVERHIGRGEYRGMEFLHVNARRIVNEVPAASRMPFRFTINAYRGCSHACTYCLAGDTLILLADGRTKPLADIRVGDEVVGTERRGSYRRYTPTSVLAHWSTVKRAFRVRLADGTELTASGDHRFLTERGWKYVTGSMCGAGHRPYLTTNNSLLGLGALAQEPTPNADYRQGYLCGVVRGDANLATYRYVRPGRAHGNVYRFRLALADLEALRRTRDYLDGLSVATKEFEFAAGDETHRPMRALRTSARSAFDAITEIIAWPIAPTPDWHKGFLAGIFDAEGSYSVGILRIANRDAENVRRIVTSLDALGFGSAIEYLPRGGPVAGVRIPGGMRTALRFFLTVDPAITRKRTINGKAVKNSADLRVVAIDDLGVAIPMYDITTGTADFVANGVISHNCFARPTHEYLGMDAGEDFERRIVVKVNAVERLRAELAPSRWAGDHIAMGTNTDPYQRCEAKYRLTQGLVHVLAEAANPFSILTKSTLILRDLELLSEAARVTAVRANFSIGTLDEEVWRATEPGTPHPRQRVEAVARLNAAGVPCGVLVAPVLPGLSDRPDQLDAVVRACVEAGAVSITPILLHLRPGVREQYLGWLAGARPDLLPAYAARYRRAYAAKSEQDVLARRVAELVARYGGRRASPAAARQLTRQPARPTAPPPSAPAPPRQLALDW